MKSVWFVVLMLCYGIGLIVEASKCLSIDRNHQLIVDVKFVEIREKKSICSLLYFVLIMNAEICIKGFMS